MKFYGARLDLASVDTRGNASGPMHDGTIDAAPGRCDFTYGLILTGSASWADRASEKFDAYGLRADAFKQALCAWPIRE